MSSYDRENLVLNRARWRYFAKVDFEKFRLVSSWPCVNILVIPTNDNNERERVNSITFQHQCNINSMSNKLIISAMFIAGYFRCLSVFL